MPWLRAGHRIAKLTEDDRGFRDYEVILWTESDSALDGPFTHALTPGLPLPGSMWAFESIPDPWVWRRLGRTVEPVQGEGEKHLLYAHTYKFSNRPPDDAGGGGGGGGGDNQTCADHSIDNPLAEPPSTSGSSIDASEEEEYDKDGNPLRYTSFEPIRGRAAEFDRHREQVVVEMNLPTLDFGFVRSLVHSLNDAPMWGLPARCWKFCRWNWRRKLYGTCSFYYTLGMVFESNAEAVLAGTDKFTRFQNSLVQYQGRHWLPRWDKYILDESQKVLNGHWAVLFNAPLAYVLDNINGAAPDRTNPRHYRQAVDPWGTPTRLVLSKTTRGAPATDEADANYIKLEKYDEADLFSLGIPVNL